MIARCAGLLAVTVLLAAPLVASGSKPIKVSAAEAAGPIFKGPKARLEKLGSETVTNVPLMQSSDRKFTAGMFSAGPSDTQIDGYPIDEFCYLLSGSATLTSADGSVLVVKAGEAVTLPKGWKGRWQTQGYTKYYVVYGDMPAE